jgi:hypothetical protein
MQGLEACRVLILVFSEHANDSDHVQREVAKAFSSGLAVIPFRIKDVLLNQSLSYFLDTVQWLDASAPPLQKHLGTLSERVKKLLVGETTRKPPKRLGPEKTSVARLPITGSDVFGREEALRPQMNFWTRLSLGSVIPIHGSEWRTILAKLRRARLLAGEDPHNPGHLDTHPLIREYFGEQLRSQQTEA